MKHCPFWEQSPCARMFQPILELNSLLLSQVSGGLGSCSEVRAVPSSELGRSWCHLWLWCHPQIRSQMESQEWVLHVQKEAPLAWCSPWIFGLPGMELCQPKGWSSPGPWTLLTTVELPQPPQWQHLPPVLPDPCTSGTSGAQEWPPGLTLAASQS